MRLKNTSGNARRKMLSMPTKLADGMRCSCEISEALPPGLWVGRWGSLGLSQRGKGSEAGNSNYGPCINDVWTEKEGDAQKQTRENLYC